MSSNFLATLMIAAGSTVLKWHVGPGDEVKQGALLASLTSSNKTCSELVSEHDGVVKKLLVKAGEVAEKDQGTACVVARSWDVWLVLV